MQTSVVLYLEGPIWQVSAEGTILTHRLLLTCPLRRWYVVQETGPSQAAPFPTQQ